MLSSYSDSLFQNFEGVRAFPYVISPGPDCFCEVNMSKRLLSAALPVALLMVGFAAGRLTSPGAVAHAQAGNRVFELRMYTTNEGKLPALPGPLPRPHDEVLPPGTA